MAATGTLGSQKRLLTGTQKGATDWAALDILTVEKGEGLLEGVIF